MIFLVLGMHKSGTSLVARILHESGVGMVEEDAPGATYDEGQFHEREAAVRINEEMLGATGRASIDIRPRSPEEDPPPELRARMRALVEHLDAQHPAWGFKDPRTCFTYPYWQEVLPEHRLIAVYRSLGATYRHYARKRGLRQRLRDPLMPLRFVRSWCEHNAHIIAALETSSAPHIVLRYEDLMRDPEELGRLSAFAGRRLHDAREPALHRQALRRSIALTLATVLTRLRSGHDPARLAARLDRFRDESDGEAPHQGVEPPDPGVATRGNR